MIPRKLAKFLHSPLGRRLMYFRRGLLVEAHPAHGHLDHVHHALRGAALGRPVDHDAQGHVDS